MKSICIALLLCCGVAMAQTTIRQFQITPQFSVGNAGKRPITPISGAYHMTPYSRLIHIGKTYNAAGAVSTNVFLPRSIGAAITYRQLQPETGKHWGISVGLHRTHTNFFFLYPPVNTSFGFIPMGGWLQSISYNNLSLGGYYHLNERFFLGGNLHYASSLRADGNPLKDGEMFDYRRSAQPFTMQIHYPGKPVFVLQPEIGWRGNYGNEKHYELTFGINIPNGAIFSQDFTFYNNGVVYAKDNVSYTLQGAYINARFPITVATLRDAANRPKPEKRTPNPEPSQAKSYKLQGTMQVSNSVITVRIFDPNAYDGDKIALFLNGVQLLDAFEVDKEGKEMTFELREGENTLVMRALNEGNTPPNTAAFSVNDGKRTQVMHLSAKEGHNVALKIQYKP